MPNRDPLPTLEDFRETFAAEVSARRSWRDTRDGSGHDLLGGTGAVLFQRISVRARDVFRAIFFDTAKGTDLDAIIESRHADLAPRDAQSKGVGTASLTRPGSGAGTFWAGTRIAVGQRGGAPLRLYEVTQDTPVDAAATAATVPVQQTEAGDFGRIDVDATDVTVLRLEDPVWDETWTVTSLTCEAGTEREEDDAVRARLREDRFANRPGYEIRIAAAMREAGAAQVAMFASDFLGAANDYSLNRIYVGDASFETTDSLLEACRAKLPDVVVAGTSVQVLPMTRVPVGFAVNVTLWKEPDAFAIDPIKQAARDAIVGYFSRRANAFYWQVEACRAAVFRAVDGVQSLTVTPTVSAPTFAALFNSYPLPRYDVRPAEVTVTLSSPS